MADKQLTKADQLRLLREMRFAKKKPNSFEDAARGRDVPNSSAVAAESRREVQPGKGWEKPKSPPSAVAPVASPSDANSGAPQPRGEFGATNATQPTGSPNIKRGRPRIGQTPDRPWIAAGMSERTWYRRQKEAKG